MADKDKVLKTKSPEELKKELEAKKDKTIKDEYYTQPPSDSEDDICGPLNCDKEL